MAILGLGLVGLVTAQILQAAGCTVWGVDPDPDRVALARELGVDFATTNFDFATDGDLPRAGGADAVIITAATKSNQPIDLAGRIARDRGIVVVVGDVRVDVARENYYRKELQLRYSRSYGPGRYDPGPMRRKGSITRRVTSAGPRSGTCMPSWSLLQPGRLTWHAW